jgi:hypothetical protein
MFHSKAIISEKGRFNREQSDAGFSADELALACSRQLRALSRIASEKPASKEFIAVS